MRYWGIYCPANEAVWVKGSREDVVKDIKEVNENCLAASHIIVELYNIELAAGNPHIIRSKDE